LSDRKNNASIATLIESDKYFRRKDDKLLKKIYNAIYYKATIDSYPDYFGEKIDTIDKYLNENTWNKIKKKYRNNNFIKSLKLDNTYEGEGIKLIINTDFKDTYKNDELTDEWSKLMFSRDEEERKVGELLAVYSLYTSGYDIGYGTFNQLIPIEFYNKVLPNYSKTLMNTIKQMLEDPLAGLDIFAMVMHKYKGLSRFINKNNVSAEYNSSVTFKGNIIIDNVLNSTNTVYYKLNEKLFNRLDIDYDRVNDVELLDDSLGDMPSFSDELNPEIQIENDSIKSNSELISDITSSVFNSKDLDIRSGSLVLYDNERFVVTGIDGDEVTLFSIANSTKYKYKIPVNQLRVLGSYNAIPYNKSLVILINNDTDILSLTTNKIVYKNDTADRRNIINAIMLTGNKKNEAAANNKVIIEKPLNGVEHIKDSKLSLELSNEFIDILSPVITKSAERENAGSNSNYMFSFGKRWTRLRAVRGFWKDKFDELFKSNNSEFIKDFNEAENLPNDYTKFQAWKSLLNKWIGTKFDLTITPYNKGWNASGFNYAYSDLDAYGNPVESMNTILPITKYVESKLGIDLSGYNSVLANIYTETQFIPPHRDITEDINAEGYAIVVLNIGADGSITDVTSDTSLPITNGGIYAFGVDGVDRFKFYHKIDIRDFGRVTPTKPITLPDGTTLENYRITLTYRRVTNPKNDNLVDKPRRIPTESEIIDVKDSIKEYESTTDSFINEIELADSLPPIEQNFTDGQSGKKMQDKFKGKSTMDLVISGDRTRTTRARTDIQNIAKNYGLSKISELKGKVVRMTDKTGRQVYTRITKVVPFTQEYQDQTWQKEGWIKNVTDELVGKYPYAIEFEVVKQSEPQIIIDEIKPEFNKLPNKSTTPTMTYAGIGSRETPQEVLNKMTEVAKYLEELGYTLRSGGAIGADKAFEKGVKSKKEVFLGSVKTGEKELKIAEEIHPAWDKMLESTKRKAIASGKNPEKSADYVANLMARNTNQIFGANLDTPVDFVLAWTQDGLTDYRKRSLQSGGTGQAIDMASRKGIPVINMANDNWRDELKSVIVKSKQPESQTEINIYAGTNENAELSNFAIRPFTIDLNYSNIFDQAVENNWISESSIDKISKLKFQSVEQAFQTFKYFFNEEEVTTNNETLVKILKTSNGAEIKKLGKTFKINTEAWDEFSYEIMESLLYASFKQNPDDLNKLLATGNAILTHKYKGVEHDNGRFSKLLMQVRDELRGTQTTETREYTPENITSLKPNEVFVFGSNARGIHGKGAALTAKEKFGAVQRQAEGLQGQSYAIITKKDFRVEKSSTLQEIGKGIQDMLLFAKDNPNLKFYVTKIGTENAGYSIPEIKGLFEILRNYIPNNVILPKEFEVRDTQQSKLQVDIKVPELTTIILEKDLSSYSIDELKNIARQLRQKAVNAREAEREGKTVLGGSQVVEDDYQAIKKYIREKESLQQSETPIIKVDKTLITEEPIINAKPSTTTTVDRKIEVDIDTYLKNKNSKLNDDQRQTMKLVYDRFKTRSSNMVVINGKAGTGKTFMLKELISYINSTLDKNNRIGVLGSSIANNIKNNLKTVIQDNTNTNIIYGFQSVNSILGIADNKRIKTSQGFSGKEKDLPKNGILLVDEASMINLEYFKMLERKAKDANTFIIYVGDSGQLFPVKDNKMAVFSSIPKSNQFTLTKAMRQKPNSLIIQYSNQFWDKAHKIDTKEIAIPNRINKDGGIVEITSVSSDNIFEAFKYAVDNKKLDYIRFITAGNPGVNEFNNNIHKKLFPNQEYGNGEFMSFNSNYLLDREGTKISYDNATKFIVKEKLTDFQITLVPELDTTIDVGDFKLKLEYNYYSVMIGNKLDTLPILTRNSYIKLNKAIESYEENDYEPTDQELISNFVHQFPDVSYDYANTLHKAQGLTFDIVIYDKGTTEYLKSTGIKGQDNAFYTATTRPKNLLLITGTVDKKASPTAISAKKLGSIIDINTNITNGTQEDVTFDNSKPTERERTSSETKTQPTETKTSSSGLEIGNVYKYNGVDYVYLFDVEGVSYYIDTVENDIVEDLPTNLPIKNQFKTVIGDNGFIYVNNTDKKSIHIYTGKKEVKTITDSKAYEVYLCNKF
jgi:predicted NAD-dependent protein-ADP-ribosyltransferase YbiA (DUF1768 family)